MPLLHKVLVSFCFISLNYVRIDRFPGSCWPYSCFYTNPLCILKVSSEYMESGKSGKCCPTISRNVQSVTLAKPQEINKFYISEF